MQENPNIYLKISHTSNTQPLRARLVEHKAFWKDKKIGSLFRLKSRQCNQPFWSTEQTDLNRKKHQRNIKTYIPFLVVNMALDGGCAVYELQIQFSAKNLPMRWKITDQMNSLKPSEHNHMLNFYNCIGRRSQTDKKDWFERGFLLYTPVSQYVAI